MNDDKLRDDRKRGFYIIDNELIDKYGPVIGAYGIAVYNLIAKFADGNGENAFPSYPTIAEKLKMSRTKVFETVEQLVDLGLIKKEQRFDKAGDMASNLYTIVHLGSTPHVLPSTYSVLPSTPSELQVVRHTDGGSTPHVPDQYPLNNTQDNNNSASQSEPLPTVGKKEESKKRSRKSKKDENKEETETPEQQAWFGAVCWVVHGHQDYSLLSEKDKSLIGKTIKSILSSDGKYTLDDLRKWYTNKWSTEWPGRQKNGKIQSPSLEQVQTGIGWTRQASKQNGFAQDVPITPPIEKTVPAYKRMKQLN